jgi:hypothetical protein
MVWPAMRNSSDEHQIPPWRGATAELDLAGRYESGKIAGNLDKTTFTFDFELNLPAKDAAAGMSCGK